MNSGISPSTSQKYTNKMNDKTIRSKRLMKELKEIQRATQQQKASFSVRTFVDSFIQFHIASNFI